MKCKEVRSVMLGQASFNATTERHQGPAHSPWARFLRPPAPEPPEMTVKSEHSRTRPPDRQSTFPGLWPRNLDFVKHTPTVVFVVLFRLPAALPTKSHCLSPYKSAAAGHTCRGGKAGEVPGVGGKGPPLSPPHPHRSGPERWNPTECGRLVRGER